MRLLFLIFAKVASFILRLRYKIEIKGLKEVKQALKDDPHSILFLSSHVSHTEPVILLSLLYQQFKPIPFIFDEVYQEPIIKQLSDIVGAISVPNFEKATNSYKKKYWERALGKSVEELGQGKNFLIYPSGQLKRTPEERLSGASGVYQLIKGVPQAKTVLIRISGLWGSAFSCAFSKESPSISKNILMMTKYVLMNLIFFMPRRKVTFEFELADMDVLRKKDNIELNTYLENWYNASFENGKEPFSNVSYTFWKKTYLHDKAVEYQDIIDVSNVSEKTKEKVIGHLQQLLEHPKPITPEMELGTDLGLDSLDLAEIITYLEQQFGARNIKPEEIQTVAGIMKVADNIDRVQLELKHTEELIQKFVQEKTRHEVEYPEGKNLQQALLRACLKRGKEIACVDEMTSVLLTYERFLLSAWLLSKKIKKFANKYVGIMLPASAGAYITIFAVLLAKKVPVMLNWTQGARHLNEAVSLTHLDTVLTSKKFVDGVQGADFGNADDLFIFLEDVKKSLSIVDKLKALFTMRFFSDKCVQSYEEVSKEKEAVILFTSGTEGPAKGVPLSHENIIENQKAALKEIPIKSTDRFYGCLPPFHSFGFNVAGLFTILSGIKVVFTPNPLDSSIIKTGLSKWKITMFCAAPSFLQPVLVIAEPKDLESVRMIISGAEAPPAKLLELIDHFGKEFIEGYGITECSPMVTVNHLGEERKGVGKPLSNIDIAICKEETFEKLGTNEKGLILISGPSVFSGYLGLKKDPFVMIDGKRYYDSGDIGYLDEERNLILTGRKKRTIKIGAEMISLTHLEHTLNEVAQESGWEVAESGNTFVAMPDVEDSKPKLILFSASNVNVDQVNSSLKTLGYANMIRFSRLIPIEFIPLMGSGKIDYRTLEAKLHA
ncbi:MAG: Bifunctional protein Aas [Chlamydiae bacterium]|nr:Bifunctional protein Aas [Chlamydiota bacterium]